jgi:FKBP-type peptidyl-prolyl cis-trans isomerase SlpA
VTLHYSLALGDGTVVDSSEGGEPLQLVVGAGDLDETLEMALVGLRPGESQTVTLMPGQAFGVPDPQARQWMVRDSFPADMTLETGAVIGFSGPDDEEVAGTVIGLEDDRVLVDFNHPLAGREIRFSVEILSVEKPEGLS